MSGINRNPTTRQLREFALGAIVFAILLGYFCFRKSGGYATPILIWIGGGIFGIFGLAIPRLIKPAFLIAALLTYPIGWLFSRIILTIFFYGVITPTGLLMRCLGHDQLHRKTLPKSNTYWIAHQPAKDQEQYFRQS